MRVNVSILVGLLLGTACQSSTEPFADIRVVAYFADSDHSFRSKSISRFAPSRSPGSVDVDQG